MRVCIGLMVNGVMKCLFMIDYFSMVMVVLWLYWLKKVRCSNGFYIRCDYRFVLIFCIYLSLIGIGYGRDCKVWFCCRRKLDWKYILVEVWEGEVIVLFKWVKVLLLLVFLFFLFIIKYGVIRDWLWGFVSSEWD